MIQIFAEWSWTAPELPVHSWWFFAIVLILLIVFMWVVVQLRSSGNDDIDTAAVDREMLTAVNELRSQGEISSDEYRSIKSRLVERLADQPASEDSEDFSPQGQPEQTSQGTLTPTAETPKESRQIEADEAGGSTASPKPLTEPDEQGHDDRRP